MCNYRKFYGKVFNPLDMDSFEVALYGQESNSFLKNICREARSAVLVNSELSDWLKLTI